MKSDNTVLKRLKLFFTVIGFLCLQITQAQSIDAKLYDTDADAEKDIEIAVRKAKESKKQVLIQAGGNWCKWCIEFNRFCKNDAQIDSMIGANYIVYHLNYSKENRNEKVFANFMFPQRFGFPVFVILNTEGKQLHIQNSVYLEDGKSYSKTKVMEFLKQWNREALAPENYMNKK